MDRAKERPPGTKKRSWKTLSVGGSKDAKETPWTLVEGQEFSYPPSPLLTRSSSLASVTSVPNSPITSKANLATQPSPPSSRPATPSTPSLPRPSLSKRWSTSNANSHVLTRPPSQFDNTSSQFIFNALDRTSSNTQDARFTREREPRSSGGSFGRMSFSSMMGGLSSLSLSRGSTDDKERGRSLSKDKGKGKVRSSSLSASQDDIPESTSSSRARSQSPFRLRRTRARDPSPAIGALTQSDVDSDNESIRRSSFRPRTAFVSPTSDDESGDETENDNDSEDEWSDKDQFDPVTERNTERNALIAADRADGEGEIADPLGEGVNVVVPPEPYFQSSINSSRARRKKSVKHHDPLPVVTSRPVFQRDRCTITVTHGDLTQFNPRRGRRYMVASDMSQESRYAIEWGIGTVLRDGDEMLLVTVVESESKVDATTNSADRVAKLRNQQERQALAYILVRQATSLLQRTKLNVTVACQAWHAKNHRHMLLDIVDYIQPTMVIVGSRGLGQLQGILLGSTSHYLIQKCSVPVMVARRRLKRPPRRAAHLAPHRARVSLAEAGIDRVAAKVDHDVEVMRSEIEKDDANRTNEPIDEQGAEDDGETDAEDLPGRKVAG